MATYLDLYRAVASGVTAPEHLRSLLNLDDEGLQRGMDPLRKLKILHVVTILPTGAWYVKAPPESEAEAQALAKAGAFDLGASF